MPLHFVAGWSTSHFLEAGLGPAGKEECDIVIFYERLGQAGVLSSWNQVLPANGDGLGQGA